MRQQDDNLTIDLYAPPRRRGDDIQISLEQHNPQATQIHRDDINKSPIASLEAIKNETSNLTTRGNDRPHHGGVDENDRVRHGGLPDKNTQDLGEKELNLAVEMGINLSQDGFELVQDAALSMGKAVTFLVKSGLELIAAKSKVNDGDFTAFCNQIGIPKQRAYEAINYAKLAAKLEPKERERYLLLPKKSALLLANAEPALVEFLLEDGNEEIAKRLRKKSELTELARELTETTDALNRHAKENEALHKELKALKEAQLTAVAGSEYPMQVVQLRKESSVLADEAIAAISSMRQHAETFEAFCMLGNDQDERNLHAGMWPALNNIASVLKAADDLLRDLCHQYGVEPTDITGRSNYALPIQELAIIEAARQTMLARKGGKAAVRQGEYIKNGDLTRGRGRPSKP